LATLGLFFLAALDV